MTAPYFHNGSLPTLHRLVRFYVTRDINKNTGNNRCPVAAGPGGNPYHAVGTFVVGADGRPDLYESNDLPTTAASTLLRIPGFAGGTAPTLTPSEIDELVAFLCTLTDGYDPANPPAYNVPAQCQPGAD